MPLSTMRGLRPQTRNFISVFFQQYGVAQRVHFNEIVIAIGAKMKLHLPN